jgi:hypothetical protein
MPSSQVFCRFSRPMMVVAWEGPMAESAIARGGGGMDTNFKKNVPF